MEGNVQIEGLADYKTWTKLRKFKNSQAIKRALIGVPLEYRVKVLFAKKYQSFYDLKHSLADKD